jgi:uncharacterized membrane protein
MDPLLVILRLLHVGLGIFWAGAIFFVVLFLEPSVRGAGPAGGAVMKGILDRRFMIVLPTVALLTLITGFWLYFRLWGGPAAASPAGMTLGLGGVAATIAFLIGYVIMRPAQLKALKLGSAVAQMPDGPERANATAEMDRLRGRGRNAARIVAVLLAIAVVTMAVGRYV